jgi:SAM-dependent methyltransferase
MPDDFYRKSSNAEAYDYDMGRSADATGDVPFYLELARQAGERGQAVLELGCGTGRVTIPIALAGVEVVGLDDAPAMLDVARRKAAAAGATVRWVTADMRSFDLWQRFGLVIIPFRSFLHMLTEDDQAACLERVFAHLLPGGRFALNFFTQPLAGRPGIPKVSTIYRSLRVRYVTRREMEELLTNAGFEIEGVFGGFNNEPLTASSSELVWIARRPEGT